MVKKKETKKKVAKKAVRKASMKKKVAKSNKRQVNWVLTLVMSIFLGWLGVDRFIMGRVGTGILKLLITVLSFGLLGWIWWIIDIILIATKYEFEGIKWVE
jgi:TM2 domain-containing membrane protein YozV